MIKKDGIKRTNVFAAKAELKKLNKLAAEASNTPMIAFSSEAALSGRDLASFAWDIFYKACYKIARKHGLPKIKGYYGLNLESGEFFKY